jgi:hypothetical protein
MMLVIVPAAGPEIDRGADGGLALAFHHEVNQ